MKTYLRDDNHYTFVLDNATDDTVNNLMNALRARKYEGIVGTEHLIELNSRTHRHLSSLKKQKDHCFAVWQSSILEIKFNAKEQDIELTDILLGTKYKLMNFLYGETVKKKLKDLYGSFGAILSIGVICLKFPDEKDVLTFAILDSNNKVHLFSVNVLYGTVFVKSYDVEQCQGISLCYEGDYKESYALLNVFVRTAKGHEMKSQRFDIGLDGITLENEITTEMTAIPESVLLHSSYYSEIENRLVHRMIDKVKNPRF